MENDVPKQFFRFWGKIEPGTKIEQFHFIPSYTHDNVLWSGVSCEDVLTLTVFDCAGDGDRVGEQVWPAWASTGGSGCCPAVGTWGEGQTLGGDRDREKLINRTLHQPHQPPHTATEQVCLPSAWTQEQGNPSNDIWTPHTSTVSTLYLVVYSSFRVLNMFKGF